MFKEGTLVEIPLPDGRTAIGWIIHISQRFKDAVGFMVLGIKGKVREDVVISSEAENICKLKALGPLYTHVDNMSLTGWKPFGHRPLSDANRSLTKRDVGGGVYVGDEYLGSVEDLNEHELRPMLAMGMPIIYQEIDKAFRDGRRATQD